MFENKKEKSILKGTVEIKFKDPSKPSQAEVQALFNLFGINYGKKGEIKLGDKIWSEEGDSPEGLAKKISLFNFFVNIRQVLPSNKDRIFSDLKKLVEDYINDNAKEELYFLDDQLKEFLVFICGINLPEEQVPLKEVGELLNFCFEQMKKKSGVYPLLTPLKNNSEKHIENMKIDETEFDGAIGLEGISVSDVHKRKAIEKLVSLQDKMKKEIDEYLQVVSLMKQQYLKIFVSDSQAIVNAGVRFTYELIFDYKKRAPVDLQARYIKCEILLLSWLGDYYFFKGEFKKSEEIFEQINKEIILRELSRPATPESQKIIGAIRNDICRLDALRRWRLLQIDFFEKNQTLTTASSTLPQPSQPKVEEVKKLGEVKNESNIKLPKNKGFEVEIYKPKEKSKARGRWARRNARVRVKVKSNVNVSDKNTKAPEQEKTPEQPKEKIPVPSKADDKAPDNLNATSSAYKINTTNTRQIARKENKEVKLKPKPKLEASSVVDSHKSGNVRSNAPEVQKKYVKREEQKKSNDGKSVFNQGNNSTTSHLVKFGTFKQYKPKALTPTSIPPKVLGAISSLPKQQIQTFDKDKDFPPLTSQVVSSTLTASVPLTSQNPPLKDQVSSTTDQLVTTTPVAVSFQAQDKARDTSRDHGEEKSQQASALPELVLSDKTLEAKETQSEEKNIQKDQHQTDLTVTTDNDSVDELKRKIANLEIQVEVLKSRTIRSEEKAAALEDNSNLYRSIESRHHPSYYILFTQEKLFRKIKDEDREGVYDMNGKQALQTFIASVTIFEKSFRQGFSFNNHRLADPDDLQAFAKILSHENFNSPKLYLGSPEMTNLGFKILSEHLTKYEGNSFHHSLVHLSLTSFPTEKLKGNNDLAESMLRLLTRNPYLCIIDISRRLNVEIQKNCSLDIWKKIEGKLKENEERFVQLIDQFIREDNYRELQSVCLNPALVEVLFKYSQHLETTHSFHLESQCLGLLRSCWKQIPPPDSVRLGESKQTFQQFSGNNQRFFQAEPMLPIAPTPQLPAQTSSVLVPTLEPLPEEQSLISLTRGPFQTFG